MTLGTIGSVETFRGEVVLGHLFVTQDPIGLAGGLNNYQYVPNPTGWVDPLGLTCSEIDYENHIFNGEVKPNGNVVGGHSTATGKVKVIPGTKSLPNAQGVYKAKIEVPDPLNPSQYLPKTNNGGYSTMFPDSWNAERVQAEVEAAFQNKTVVGNKWTGVTPSGVTVEGWLAPKTTVYPKL